jgi:uncharacterized protein (DUF1778 family)
LTNGIIFPTIKIMARPPKDTADRKNVDLRIPVTAEQKRLVSQAATLEGLDMAAWARQILVREAQRRLRREAGND